MYFYKLGNCQEVDERQAVESHWLSVNNDGDSTRDGAVPWPCKKLRPGQARHRGDRMLRRKSSSASGGSPNLTKRIPSTQSSASRSPDEIGRPDLPPIARCIGEYNLELSRNPLSSSVSTTESDNRPRVIKSMSNYLAKPVLSSMISSSAADGAAAADSGSFRSWALPDSLSTSRNASPTSNSNSDYSGNTSPLTNSDLQDCLNRFAAEGNQESLKAFLNETEYDDEGVYSLNGWTSNGCHPNKNDPTVTSQSPHSEVESSVSCNKRGIDKRPVRLNSGAGVVDPSLEALMKDLSSKLDRLIRSSKEMTKEVKGINSTFKECDSRLDVVQEKAKQLKLSRQCSEPVPRGVRKHSQRPVLERNLSTPPGKIQTGR